MKLKITIFFIVNFIIFLQSSYCQSSGVQPTPILGSNLVSFDSTNSTYNFYFNDSLVYSYDILPGTTTNGGSFNVLKAYDTNGKYFLPSNFGGIRAFLDNDRVYPFNPGVTFNLLGHKIIQDDTVLAYWQMNYKKEHIKYAYKFKIVGRTLIINLEVDSSYSDKVLAFDLDRCENVNSPAAIAIPYLPLFYILYGNNMFTSFFTDWEVSNASQLIAYDGSIYSKSSLRYAQSVLYNTRIDHHRNIMIETFYLTTSTDITNVFSNIPNPVSNYKKESANSIIWDFRPPFNQLISPSTERYMDKMYADSIKNIWIQIHNWQANHGADKSYGYSGYDDGLPCVLPANIYYGGNFKLNSVISKARLYKYRIGLHENYVDYYMSSKNCSTGPGYLESDVALDQYGEKIKAYKNDFLKGEQSYLLKPSRTAFYTGKWSRLIQAAFPKLNGCYLDVHSSILPITNYVDYDTSVNNAGKFKETMYHYRSLFDSLRNNHHGPIQGEGGNQIFYQGYADDIEARIAIPNKSVNGVNFPVIVDFDMLKLRSKAFVHGVGYYPIFYTNSDYKTPRVTREIVLQYIATELAYGHGGYIPSPDLTWYSNDSITAHAKLEHKFVYQVQNDYANSSPLKILYNDNDTLKTISDFIKSHPKDYADITSDNFMGQVMIVYKNGVIVCVNRHPQNSWKVDIGKQNGWFDFHANGDLETKNCLDTTFKLPPKNGWVVYDPFK